MKSIKTEQNNKTKEKDSNRKDREKEGNTSKNGTDKVRVKKTCAWTKRDKKETEKEI